MTNGYHKENEEVLYANADINIVCDGNIKELKNLSEDNPRQRIRLCAHTDQNDLLHEMLIVHKKNTYVRPHKHLGKSESTHIIEGLVDIIVFNDDGRIEQVISMGDYASGKAFYFRMSKPFFHTLLIRSEILVFHEITNGPFDRRTTLFAPWAPDESDAQVVTNFRAGLELRLKNF